MITSLLLKALTRYGASIQGKVPARRSVCVFMGYHLLSSIQCLSGDALSRGRIGHAREGRCETTQQCLPYWGHGPGPALSRHHGTFSGPGWDLLLAEGRKSSFSLVGEEHGVAEIPAVVRELFRALQPAGYRHLAIEISPPMAAVLDEQARGADGLQKLSAFYAEHPPGVAFFTLREEAELLVAARAASPGNAPVLWGLDYEITADRYLFDRMRQKAPDGPARAAVEALHEKSVAAWKTVSTEKNPAAFFSFANPREILDDLRRAWPNPDPESALALDVIGETLAINRAFVEGSRPSKMLP